MKKKKLFSLALSAVLILSTVIMPVNVAFGAGTAYTESEDKNGAENATYIDISKGNSISGEFGYNFDVYEKWYKFDVEKSSIINFEADIFTVAHDYEPTMRCEVYREGRLTEYLFCDSIDGYRYTTWYLEPGDLLY